MAGGLAGGAWPGATLLPSPHPQPVSAPWAGSLWDPNITVDTLDSYRLRVSFTLWDEPAHYLVLLSSYPRGDNRTCFTDALEVATVTAP